MVIQLPFGGVSAPGIFHCITQAVKQMMAPKEYTLLVVYLDDFLVIGEIKEACLKIYNLLCKLLVDLSDCNGTRTHNHLVYKRTLNHLAKLA